MPDELDKILEDAFEMGVNHGKGLWNDFPQLKKGMEAKLNTLFQKREEAAFQRGHEDCRMGGDPTNHKYFNEAVLSQALDLIGKDDSGSGDVDNSIFYTNFERRRLRAAFQAKYGGK